MSDKNINPPALDHATARIVSELAAALLPPLERVISEQAAQTTTEADDATRRIEGPLEDLRHEFRELNTDFIALKTDITEVTHALRAVRSDLKEHSEAMTRTMERTVPKTDETQHCAKPRFHLPGSPVTRRATAVSAAGAFVRKGKQSPKKDENEAPLQEFLELRLPEWEGFLRAGGRAQTQELEALSQEVSELLRDTRATLLQEVRELLSRELSEKNATWLQAAKATGTELNRKMAWLQVGMMLLGLGCVAALIALAAALTRG